jgi:anti-sigma factor RsiW
MAVGPTDIDKDALLVAYLDGELERGSHDEVERLLRGDAEARARLFALIEGGQQLRSSYDY